MRVLVCGSRHFNDYIKLEEVLNGFGITEIIEGEAAGADRLSRVYGERHRIPVARFPADWTKYGKAAGAIRNKQMLVEGQPELVIAFRGPNSRGTQNMINQARKAGIETVVIDVQTNEPSST